MSTREKFAKKKRKGELITSEEIFIRTYGPGVYDFRATFVNIRLDVENSNNQKGIVITSRTTSDFEVNIEIEPISIILGDMMEVTACLRSQSHD